MIPGKFGLSWVLISERLFRLMSLPQNLNPYSLVGPHPYNNDTISTTTIIFPPPALHSLDPAALTLTIHPLSTNNICSPPKYPVPAVTHCFTIFAKLAPICTSLKSRTTAFGPGFMVKIQFPFCRRYLEVLGVKTREVRSLGLRNMSEKGL